MSEPEIKLQTPSAPVRRNAYKSAADTAVILTENLRLMNQRLKDGDLVVSKREQMEVQSAYNCLKMAASILKYIGSADVLEMFERAGE